MNTSPELINLVPPEKMKSFHRTYFTHLIIVVILAISILILIQGVLLVPSYIYERQAVSTAQNRLKALSDISGNGDNKIAQAHIAAFQKESSTLQKLASIPTASSIISALLLVPHKGITLNGFTYTPGTGTNQPSLIITGIASTRDTLQAYQTSLAALPYVKKADLPISAYAKESAIPFIITLTGPLTP
jgi:hypothetical protein